MNNNSLGAFKYGYEIMLNQRPQIIILCVAVCAVAYFPVDTHSSETVRKYIHGSPWICRIIDDSSRGADGVRLADINDDDLMDITTGWEEGGITRVYVNPGYAHVKDKWPSVTIGTTPSVEDAFFVDLDNDGSSEVISSCEGKTKTLFVHHAPEAKVKYFQSSAWTQEAIISSIGKMQWMFCIPLQVDGENGVDIIAAGKNKNARIGWFEVPSDSRSYDRYTWHNISTAGWIMSLKLSDMDGDGDKDVVCSDRRGEMRGCRWLENPGSDQAYKRTWTNHYIGGRDKEVMFMTINDLDGDGLEDVLVAAKPAQILYFRRLDKHGDTWEQYAIPFPDRTGTAKAVAVGDMDNDGRRDIVFSCEQADDGKAGVMWLSYRDSVFDTIWQPHTVSGPSGIKYDRIELIDFDGDGDLDILTCEERHKGKGIGVLWYENPHRK